MKIIKMYEYPNCTTCKKAVKFLVNNRFPVERVNIFERAPTKTEIKLMLKYLDGNLRRIFNTTGTLYKEMKLAEKLPKMTEDEAIELLTSNGRLVKRPFLLLESTGLIGFHESQWREKLLGEAKKS